MKISDVYYAVGFLRNGAYENSVYTPQVPWLSHTDGKLVALRLTVVEAKSVMNSSNETENGWLLLDQHGDMWGYNYPKCDETGRGIIFQRVVPEEADYAIIAENMVMEVREA